MEDKVRQELLEGLDRMGEMLEDLRTTTYRCIKPKQPEPQAGDVWTSGIYTVFVHRDKKDNTRELTYTYVDGDEENASGCSIRTLIREYPYTLIFSLPEHLKNKGADNG